MLGEGELAVELGAYGVGSVFGGVAVGGDGLRAEGVWPTDARLVLGPGGVESVGGPLGKAGG